MKIVHLAPNAPYNDNWGYQENLLPKYQAKLGHEVTVITTNKQYENGKIVEINEADYRLSNGVRVIRRKWKAYPRPVLTGLYAYLPALELLEEIQPDFIFFHGMVSRSIFDAVMYKKNCGKKCVIVQDNHLDYYNSRNSNDFRGKLIRSFYRRIVRKTISAVEKVYGVTEWRKQFAQEYFCVPANKTDTLIMGADDEQLDLAHKTEIRERIRNRFHISSNEFLIVSGGKIDESKKIHLLAEAINQMPGSRLLVFGNMTSDMEERFQRLKSERIDLVGWIPSNETYDYFLAADLVCFPGTHSVLWEQACASKVPCVFARWDGMEHVNNGGNSAFIDDVSVDGIKKKLRELFFTDAYFKMKMIAESEKTDIYLYSNIAKKSLETVEDLQIACRG